MRALALACLVVLIWVSPATAGDSEWELKRPKSSPHGKPHTLRVTLDETKAHRGEVTYEQTSKLEQGGLTVRLGFVTHVRVLEALEKKGGVSCARIRTGSSYPPARR